MSGEPFFNDDLNRARRCRIRNVRPKQPPGAEVISLFSQEPIGPQIDKPYVDLLETITEHIESGLVTGLGYVVTTVLGQLFCDYHCSEIGGFMLIAAVRRLDHRLQVVTDRVNGSSQAG